MAGKNTKSTETTELKSKFELQLPKELQIKPLFEFKVSQNCTMVVYESTMDKNLYADGKQVTVSALCYEYVVLGKSGQIYHKAMDPYRSRRENSIQCETLLDVMLDAKRISYELIPKKRQVKVVDEDIEDEDD